MSSQASVLEQTLNGSQIRDLSNKRSAVETNRFEDKCITPPFYKKSEKIF